MGDVHVSHLPGVSLATPGGVSYAPGGVSYAPGGVSYAPGGVSSQYFRKECIWRR